MNNPICAIAGVGPGNGAAFARKFASENYHVALLARNEDHIKELESRIVHSRAYPCDLTDAEQSREVFARIHSEMGPVDTLIYNAGGGKFANIDDTSPEEFETAWRINALGCFMAVKHIVSGMREIGRGNIVIIGATASKTGNAGFLPFAAAKAAQRSLAQSIARQLGPSGVHVAYVIIDAVIDLPRTRQAMPDQPDAFFANPNDIAESVYFLTQQPRSAWTFELDLRPFGEKW